MATFTSNSPINLNSFYSPTTVFAPFPAHILTASPTSYWVQLNDGTYLRYSGSNLSYSAADFPNGALELVPLGGTYTQVDITDAAGNILSSWTGFGSRPANEIVFISNDTATNIYADYVGLSVATLQAILGGNDTLTGSNGTDILHGYNNADTFNLTAGADQLYGDLGDDVFSASPNPTSTMNFGAQTIDGGGGSDTLKGTFLAGLSIADFTNTTFNSIERIQFVTIPNTNPYLASVGRIIVNGSSIGAGLASNLSVVFSAAGGSELYFDATTSGTYSAENFIFTNSGRTVFDSNNAAINVNWIGSGNADIFRARGVGDSFSGGPGFDYAQFVDSNVHYTGTISGGADYGNGFEAGDFQGSAAGNIVDLTGLTISFFNSLTVYGNATTTLLLASQLGGFASNSALTLANDSVIDLTMGSTLSIDLSTWNVTSFLKTTTNADIIIHGGSSSETFIGSNSNDRIVADGGDDTVNGGLGNDFLDGGAGADFLLGGEGDDTIVFDALDVAVNVDGGNGADTLVFVNDFTHFNFNLGAQHFEQADVQQTDLLSNQLWSKIDDFYTATWLRYLTTMTFDNNNTRDTIYDYTNTQAYITLRQDFSPSHVKAYEYYAFDNGTSRDTTFDYTPGIVWSSLRQDYDASNFRTYEYYVYDNGSSRDTTFDNTPGIVWQSLRNDYDAASFKTYEYFVFDNGTSRDTTFDNTPGVVWSSLRNDYNAASQKTYTYYVFDNGTQRDVSLDYTAGVPWKSLTQNYDASIAHKMTDQYFIFDNDTARYVEFGTFAGHPGATSHTTNYADAAGTIYLNDFYV